MLPLMTSRAGLRSLVLIASNGWLILSACTGNPEVQTEPTTFTVRDSSGVEIVESTEPAWSEGEAWTLSEEPLLAIGTVDGPDEYNLYRSVGAIRLADGRIVVGNGGSQELRFYSPEGSFLHASGGEGEGPGEFRSIGFIWRKGVDSLAVLDYRLLRISMFDESGMFGRAFRFSGGDRDMVFPHGIFGDGTVLASATVRDDGRYSETGSFRDLLDYQHFDGEGVFLSKVVVLPGPELFSAILPDGAGITTSPRHGLTPWTVTGSETWHYGSSDAYELQEWSAEGRLLRVLRLEKERRPTPAQDIAEWEERVRGMDSGRKQLWESLPVASHLPAFEQVLLDRAGNLWMAEYLILDEAPVWQVVSSEGHWLGSVTMPPGGRISEIGEDYVLGTWRDELDVETVRMYALLKPGTP